MAGRNKRMNTLKKVRKGTEVVFSLAHQGTRLGFNIAKLTLQILDAAIPHAHLGIAIAGVEIADVATEACGNASESIVLGSIDLLTHHLAGVQTTQVLPQTTSAHPINELPFAAPQVEEDGACGASPLLSSEHDSDSSINSADDGHGTDFNNTKPPKCFVPNTAFKSPDGHLLLVQNLRLGDKVFLANGMVAHVVLVQAVPMQRKAPYDLVELVTNQSSFRSSVSHRIAVADAYGNPTEARAAGSLKVGDGVFVGTKKRALTKVNLFTARTQLINVSFVPDGPVESFLVPTWGLQTRGEPPCAEAISSSQSLQPSTVMDIMAGISEAELLRAMPETYDD